MYQAPYQSYQYQIQPPYQPAGSIPTPYQPSGGVTAPYAAKPLYGGVFKTVTSAQEIMPQDVPMDGSMALFMLADGSEVIGKQWTADGKIAETHFTPKQQDNAAPSFEQTVLSRLDAIEGMLAPRRARKPKEADDAER